MSGLLESRRPAWASVEGNDGLNELRAAIVMDNGTSITVNESVPLGALKKGEAELSVAFTGAHYFVVWRDPSAPDAGIRGMFISEDGEVVRSVDLAASSDARVPAVAGNRGDFLVVWQKLELGVDLALDIVGQWVDANSGVPSEPFLVCGLSDQQIACFFAKASTERAVGPLVVLGRWPSHRLSGISICRPGRPI